MSNEIDEQQVAAFWNRRTKSADDDDQTGYLGEEWPPAMARNRFRGELRDVTRWIERGVPQRDAYLDVGCGTGIWLEHLAPMFKRASGTDLSDAMVESARLRMARLGLDVSVEQGSVVELDVEEAYDLIFMGGVLMFLPREAALRAVANLRRALRPGGLLIARESGNRTGTRFRENPLSPGLFADPDAERPPYYAMYRHPPAIAELLREGGLDVERTVYNRHYKLYDMTEGWMWFLNWLHRGRLRTDHAAAERWAQRVHSLRALTLLPYFYVVRALRIPAWNLENYFFLCRRP